MAKYLDYTGLTTLWNKLKSKFVTIDTEQTISGAKTFSKAVTASSFVKSGGTSSQLLLANGGTQDLYSINAASVQGYKFLLDIPYKSTLGVFTNDTGNVWYLHLTSANYFNSPTQLLIYCKGAYQVSYVLINAGTGGDRNLWGWQSEYNGKGIAGIYKSLALKGTMELYLKISACMSQVIIYNCTTGNFSCEKLDSCDVTFEDAGGFWFGNKAPLTSTDIGALTDTEIANVLV